ncbi:hypothetical protein BRD17_09145 [Halobacteriales archaeon SW_7_68_16]|nr:MAG: hypothetical protein BRD17_09145 [Halobacteriales archaeon SW_7_68_16]
MDVLVVGATGRQGGSVVDHLLSEPSVRVAALTRRPESDAARALADRGVEVLAGDLTDPQSLRGTVEGVDAVFGLAAAGTGRTERRQGSNLVNAAEAAGVDHVVFSSWGHADDRPGIDHVDAKHDVERQLAAADVTGTVVRPHTFTTTLARQRGAIERGAFRFPLRPGVALPLTDPDDVGRFVARAVTDPERFGGHTVELAGEALTIGGMAATFEAVLDRPIEAVPEEPRGPFSEWLTAGHAEVIDPEGVADRFDVRTRTLREYLERIGWGTRPG